MMCMNVSVHGSALKSGQEVILVIICPQVSPFSPERKLSRR